VRGYYNKSNFTYKIGDYDDKLNTEVISIMCCENSEITTFYNNCAGVTN
jgi:hypothetical protein